MKLSCVTASYVGEGLGYPGPIDWNLASTVIERQPILETVASLLRRLAPAKLDGIELWMPHASPNNLTPVLAGRLRRLMALHGTTCCAYAGSLPDPALDSDGAESAFQAAMLLRAPVIAAHLSPAAVPRLTSLCAQYGIRLAFENGAEPLQELRAVVAGSDPAWVGINLDTGNLAAQGDDPVQALRELGSRVIHMHFKDVPAVGSHDCVALGRGIVDVKGITQELKALNYGGWLSVELETGDRDPTDEIVTSIELLRSLL